MIDIITRTRNRTVFLERAMKDIAAQTYNKFNLIIVNDGGNIEEVNKVVDKYKSNMNIKVIHNDTARGMAKSSNIGITMGNAKYIVIHDDDDTWETTFLEQTIAYLEDTFAHSNNIKGVATHIKKITESVDHDNIKYIGETSFNSSQMEISLFRMLGQNQFAPIAFVFARETLDKIGVFNEALETMDDWEFNIRFLTVYNIGLIREVLANYHVRDNSNNTSYVNSIVTCRDKMKTLNTITKNEALRKVLPQNEGLVSNLSQRLTELERKLDKILEIISDK